MPITYRLDASQNILFVKRTGGIDSQDEEEAFAGRGPDVPVGIPVIADCRWVEPTDSTATVRYLADHITSFAAKLQCGPVAILVASDAEYGMARMYQTLTDLAHPNTEVFRDYDEALAWLRGGGNDAPAG